MKPISFLFLLTLLASCAPSFYTKKMKRCHKDPIEQRVEVQSNPEISKALSENDAVFGITTVGKKNNPVNENGNENENGNGNGNGNEDGKRMDSGKTSSLKTERKHDETINEPEDEEPISKKNKQILAEEAADDARKARNIAIASLITLPFALISIGLAIWALVKAKKALSSLYITETGYRHARQAKNMAYINFGIRIAILLFILFILLLFFL